MPHQCAAQSARAPRAFTPVASALYEPMHVVDEHLAGRFLDFGRAAIERSGHRTRADWRIPSFVLSGWEVSGFAILSASEIARRYGVTRDTIRKAIKRNLDAGIIRVAGYTSDGRAMFEPCLEIGDEWRNRFNARRAASGLPPLPPGEFFSDDERARAEMEFAR